MHRYAYQTLSSHGYGYMLSFIVFKSIYIFFMTYFITEYFGGKVDELDEHIQKKNDGNGLDEQDAKHIFRQV